MVAHHRIALRFLFAGASLAALTAPFAAQAQEAASGGIDEIIVTAQRREQRLQDVPIAVSAISASALQSKGVQNTMDLVQVVPSLVMNSQAGATQVRIRGVGTTNFGPGVENPVAIYVDGVYIASTSGAFFSLTNIERVETLKGPQGTLFGRNATGGLVQVITADPSDKLKGLLRAGYANYDTATVDGYVSGPLSNAVAADLAVHYAHSGKGWGHNIHTGGEVNTLTDDLIIRSKLKIQATDNLKFLLAGDYSLMVGNRGVTIQELPGSIGGYDRIYYPPSSLPVNHGGWYDTDSFKDPHARVEAAGGSLTASLGIGDAELKSITAYRSTRMPADFALTRVPLDALLIEIHDKWDQFSQEFQINGKAGHLDYTGGLYYFTSIDKYDPFHLPFGTAFSPIAFPGSINALQHFNNRLKTDSFSAYGQATYEILPGTHITLGGRYTDELKRLSGTQSLSVTYPAPVGTVYFVPEGTPYAATVNPRQRVNNFSYRIALDHKLTPDIMAYASFNTGFKSGGYNLTTPTNPAFLPEKIKALEAGLKTELFDRHLRLNLSVFHYDYTDMQVNNFTGTSTFIVNGGRSKIDGFEVEAEAKVAAGLTLNAGLGYTNARFTDFPNAAYNFDPSGTGTCAGGTSTGNPNTPCLYNAKGNKIPNTPAFNGNIGFAYEHSFNEMLFGLSGNVFHTSKTFGTFDNDPRAVQEGYELVNGSVYVEPGNSGLRFTVWGKNLFGVKYSAVRYVSTQQIAIQAGAPRTYGVTVEKKF